MKDSRDPGVAELAIASVDARTLRCPECNGDGGWERPTGAYSQLDGGLYTVWQECRECEGSGEIEVEAQPVTPDDLPLIWSDDPEMNAALEADFAKLEAMGAFDAPVEPNVARSCSRCGGEHGWGRCPQGPPVPSEPPPHKMQG